MKLLTNIKNKLKGLWKFVDGNKTYIGVGLHAVWFVSNVVFKDMATTEQGAYGHALIGTITGTGIAHKIDKKTNVISNTINNLKKK